MELAGCQRNSISSPVLDHFYASLYAKLLCSNFSRNYGIVLADIIVNLLRLQFWEYSWHFLVTFEGYACNICVALLLHFQYFQIIFPRCFRSMLRYICEML